MNPQEEHPDHLQPQPKVSYPGSRMCAVVTEASSECQIWMKQPNSTLNPNEVGLTLTGQL